MAHLFQYALIISVAALSSTSARLLPKNIYEMLDYTNRNDKEPGRNNYLFLPSNSVQESPHFQEVDKEQERQLRYLGDNNIRCEISEAKVVLADKVYQYFPSEYINKTCAFSSSDPFKIESNGVMKPEMCLHNDNEFGCQTVYDELNILKKRIGGVHQCWEHMTEFVGIGCKCNIHFTYNL